jgi:hypothetical protein
VTTTLAAHSAQKVGQPTPGFSQLPGDTEGISGHARCVPGGTDYPLPPKALGTRSVTVRSTASIVWDGYGSVRVGPGTPRQAL